MVAIFHCMLGARSQLERTMEVLTLLSSLGFWVLFYFALLAQTGLTDEQLQTGKETEGSSSIHALGINY